ncbi:glycosyltransferase family 2 protein [Buttiauxella massiliensis]|uniref:glycosyltransferase family 2 protein n=1 Tax=Buttiauxella massiliensis TaxID=2831590 RepID=UPI00125F8E9E|nr:glycosyltransferase family 2 protein [Buttiauxella massiliensis]
MDCAKISIITATYNSLPYIVETYNSIKNQTHLNWEWLITDDCSSDETYNYLLSISSADERIKVFRNFENSGAAVSRNNSINNASGDFLAFIDSDDLWCKEKLRIQLHKMLDNELDFTFTAYELINEHSEPLNKIIDSTHNRALCYLDMLKKQATLGCSTVMLRRSRFPNLSMPLIRTGQDYALWLKLLKDNCQAYPLNEVLMQYRILPNSISRNKIRKAKRQWEIYREIECLSMVKALECFAFYAWRAIFRK